LLCAIAFLLAGIPAEDDLNSYESAISCTLTANSPITLRFSRLVGDIMREIGDWDLLTNFKYYT
jgi:hypothetical protein